MIVEDENGNDIDLNDLRDDREPEEPEAEPPLDLDELDQWCQKGWGESRVTGQYTTKLLDAVPSLIAELRHWRSLEKEPQHGVLLRNPVEWLVCDDAETAQEAAKAYGGTAGVRDIYTTPWTPPWTTFSSEPPF